MTDFDEVARKYPDAARHGRDSGRRTADVLVSIAASMVQDEELATGAISPAQAVATHLADKLADPTVDPERLAHVRIDEDAHGYWSLHAQRERDMLGDRRYRKDFTRVQADVFKPSGKWMYRVYLDYTGEDLNHYQGWQMARRALARATKNKTSEVTFAVLPDDWFMVVTDPPQGYPITVWNVETEGKS